MYPFIASLGEGVSTRHFSTGNSSSVTYGSDTFHYPDGVGNVCYVDGYVDSHKAKINNMAESRRYWDIYQNMGGRYREDEEESP